MAGIMVVAAMLMGGPGDDPTFAGLDENRPLGTEAGYRMDDYQRDTRAAGSWLWDDFKVEHGTNGTHNTGIFAAVTNNFLDGHLVSNNVIAGYHVADGSINTNHLAAAIAAPLVLLFSAETATTIASFNAITNITTAATIASNKYRYLLLDGEALCNHADTTTANTWTLGFGRWLTGAFDRSFEMRSHSASAGAQKAVVRATWMTTGGASTNETYYFLANSANSKAGLSVRAYNFRVWGVP